MKAGVLALQGDFREHAKMLREAGATPVLVRTREELDSVECLVIPGGESTAIGRLAKRHGLIETIRDRAEAEMPIFGTCAGMIVMAKDVDGGEPLLGMMDISVERNAYGRQVDSFEADVDVRGLDRPVRGVFIRAPVVARIGEGVEVLAEHEGRPITVEQGRLLAASFHPEIAGDPRLHARFLEKVE